MSEMSVKKARRPEARPILLSAPYGKFWNNINKNTSEFGNRVLPQSTQVSTTSFQEETGTVCSTISQASSQNTCEPVCTNSESNTSNSALFKSKSDQEENCVKEEKTSTRNEECQTVGSDNSIIPVPIIELTQISKINHTSDSNLELKIILTRLPESVYRYKPKKDIKSCIKQLKTSGKKRVSSKMEPEIFKHGVYDASVNDICLKDSYSPSGSENTGNVTKSIALCSSNDIRISEEKNEQTVSEMSSTSRSNGYIMVNGGCSSKNKSAIHKNTSDSRQQAHSKKTENTRKRKSVSSIENTKKRNKIFIKFTPRQVRNSSDSSKFFQKSETTTSASKKRLKRCVNNEIETCLKTRYEKQFGPLTRCEVRLKKLSKRYLERAIAGAVKYKNIQQRCDTKETKFILKKRLKDTECERYKKSVSNCANCLEYNDDWGNDTIDSWGNVRYISKDHSNYNELEEDWRGWLVRIDSLQDTWNAHLYSLSDGVTESRIVVWNDHPYSNICEENGVRSSDIVHLSGKPESACEESQDSDEDWPGWNVLYVDINVIDESSSVSRRKKALSGFPGW